MYVRNIKVENAEPGMQLTEAVYATSDKSTLVARKGYVIDDTLIRVLRRRGIERVPVWSETEPSEDEMMHPLNKADDIKFEEQCYVKGVLSDEVKKAALNNIKQLFISLDHSKNTNMTTAYHCVRNLDSVVGDLLRAISHDEAGLIHISDLKHHDEYTYHHSLSVSLLSIVTGRELGLSVNDLLRLGRCAMLHDIGKQVIPLAILNKGGPLDSEEFETIKQHPMMGAQNLKASAVGDVELWNGILFHHERMNGTGYPKGLVGNEIPLFSRIIAVADVYDAITSYRPYRSPMLPSHAVEHIYKDAGKVFDHDVVNAFFEKLEFYPVNTVVRLSDKRVALVYESEPEFRLRPVVRIWSTDQKIRLAAPENAHLQISAVLSHSSLPPGYEFR